MRLSLKTLLIWCLVCCVPAQVAAAATMALCGVSHRAVAGAHVDHTPHAQHNRPADHVDHVDHVKPADTRADGAHGQHKCSACASCCGAFAMLGTALQIPTPQFDPPAFAAPVTAVPRVAADGPDRPPRRMAA